MKFFVAALTLSLSLTAMAKKVEVDVLSSEIGVHDHNNRKTLCLTVVRVPKAGNLLGLVEDIGDCFYARKAKKLNKNRMVVELDSFKQIEHRELRKHLQTTDAQLKFYISTGE